MMRRTDKYLCQEGIDRGATQGVLTLSGTELQSALARKPKRPNGTTEFKGSTNGKGAEEVR